MFLSQIIKDLTIYIWLRTWYGSLQETLFTDYFHILVIRVFIEEKKICPEFKKREGTFTKQVKKFHIFQIYSSFTRKCLS
jgi:hypothetical protein